MSAAIASSARRAPYIALAVATIVAGLAVHLRGDALPPSLRDIIGDALWASMVVWVLAAIAPWWRPAMLGGAALAISYAVEFSQLYRSSALDAVRETTVGHLALGSGFDPRDLAAYAAGVLAAVLFDRAAIRGWKR